jgi:hypothetical protein
LAESESERTFGAESSHSMEQEEHPLNGVILFSRPFESAQGLKIISIPKSEKRSLSGVEATVLNGYYSKAFNPVTSMPVIRR